MLPSILNDSTSFWLDFAGSRLPETSKIEEKLRLEISVFFNTENKCRKPVFPDFGVHFDVSFGARSCKKMLFFFLEGSFPQFGLAFCFQGRLFSLRAHFFSPKPCVLRWCFSKSSVSFESEAKSTPSGSILGSVFAPGAAIRARFFCPNALNHRSWVNYVLTGVG